MFFLGGNHKTYREISSDSQYIQELANQGQQPVKSKYIARI